MAEDGNQAEVERRGPRIPPRRMSEAEYTAASKRRTARVIGVTLTALAVGLTVLAIVGRYGIVALWPSTAGVYRSINLVEAPDAGLKITLSVTRTGGGLAVAGDIVNGASEARELPRLRVSLHDARRNEVDVKTIDPPVARLAAGATAHFDTMFEHPSMTATGAAAIFATDR